VLLRVAMTSALPDAAQIRREMADAAARARAAAEESNGVSDLSSCKVFKADKELASQGLECPISTEPIKEGDTVMKLPCEVSAHEEDVQWLALRQSPARLCSTCSSRKM
jgi:hypothetical protein